MLEPSVHVTVNPASQAPLAVPIVGAVGVTDAVPVHTPDTFDPQLFDAYTT
ncbi:MAG: hypothetical protein PHE49_09040 [bacterium]|nr:hypothetical protein [bacterium]